MARSRWQDFLQDHLFWCMDISGAHSLPVFTPLFGFSGISAPKINVEVDTIKDGTYLYPRHLIKGANVNEITFTRAASIYDSDFYDWIYYAIHGTTAAKDAGLTGFLGNLSGGPVRRSLLIFHFARINANGNEFLKILANGTLFSVIGAALGGTAGAVGGAVLGAGSAALGAPVGFGVGPFEAAAWLPARAWILHDCLDEQTEILSPRGWLKYNEVGVGDEIYSMNTTTNKLEITAVDAYVHRPAAGEEMISVEGRSKNFRITSKHNLYYRRNERGRLQRIAAGDFFDMGGELQMPVAGMADFPGVSLSDDELRLIAWFITDGHFKEKQRLIIGQAKDYKNEIRALLTRLDLHFTERIKRPGSYKINGLPLHQFGIPKGTSGLNGWDKYNEYLDKSIYSKLHQMTRKQFIVFYTELLKGDGSFRNRGLSGSQLTCASREMADNLMQMAVLRGFGASATRYVTNFGKEMWTVYLSEREWMTTRPARMRVADEPMIKAPAQPGEYVWCVSNRNGTLITRRNGKVLIMGNCIPISYTSGSDLDANSGAVSLAQLTVQPEWVEQFDMGL